MTYDKLKEIIVEQLGVKPEQVTPEAVFECDLGADSLDHIELLMGAEQEFGIVIADAAAERVKTVAEAVPLIDQILDIKRRSQA